MVSSPIIDSVTRQPAAARQKSFWRRLTYPRRLVSFFKTNRCPDCGAKVNHTVIVQVSDSADVSSGLFDYFFGKVDCGDCGSKFVVGLDGDTVIKRDNDAPQGHGYDKATGWQWLIR